MKKSTKLISLLLALTMLLGIIPMAVAADDGTIVKDGVTLYTNTKPRYFTFLRNNAEDNVTKNVGKSGVYQRLPRYTNICSCGRTLVECIPDEYAANAQKTVELSDPTVLKDLSYTISGWSNDDFYSGDPCLTFNFTAAKPGTTTVKLTFYYNYNFDGASGRCQRCGRYANIPAMNTWLQETTTFTFTVTGDSGEDEKPDVTVTYTDGVDGTAFADQVYTVKEGDPTPAFAGTPTRKGYKFLGWEPTVAETVTANATYTAKWEMDIPDVRYVQIRVRCVDPIDSSKHLYIDYGVIPSYGTSKGIEEIDGEYYYTFTLSEAQKTAFINNYDGVISSIVKETCKHVPAEDAVGPTITWKWVNDEWVCQNTVIADHPVAPVVASIDVVCGNIVTFDPDNGEDTFIQSVKFGQKAQKPADPEKDGYVFLGWYAEGAEEPFDFETVIEAPLTLTAKWEEALTDVTVTSNISEGKLLFLGDEFKVTATANTDANLTFNFESNPAFKQITSSSTSNSKTVWYRVVKITGGYTKVNVSVTGAKGKQEPVTGTLTFGVNLRNRIHVNIVDAENNVISNIEDIKLIHKYTPSSSKALKYDAVKQEYVMANAWDLSVDDFEKVQFTYDGEVYEIAETTDGTDLRTAIKDGTKEIYVSYKIVAPINVMVEVDGEVVKTEKFKGMEGEKLDYVALYWEVMNKIQAEGKMATVQILIDDAVGTEAIFGTNKNVKIVIKTL